MICCLLFCFCFFLTLPNLHDFNTKLPDMFNDRQFLIYEREVGKLKSKKPENQIPKVKYKPKRTETVNQLILCRWWTISSYNNLKAHLLLALPNLVVGCYYEYLLEQTFLLLHPTVCESHGLAVKAFPDSFTACTMLLCPWLSEKIFHTKKAKKW